MINIKFDISYLLKMKCIIIYRVIGKNIINLKISNFAWDKIPIGTVLLKCKYFVNLLKYE